MRLGAEDASERVVKALSNTLASARGRWILGKRAEEYSEWALVGSEVSGTVDRAFRDEDGRFWIIDFKTGEHKGGNLSEFLKNEKRRYSQQLESYASIVSSMKAGPIYLGLYFPLLDEWVEWEYSAAEIGAS
jgi:ATP-dependent exoDNAse (exonuclease V) beta subunit